MDRPTGRRSSAAAPITILQALGVLAAAGCQAYEPAPLDLAAHRAALARRPLDVEPIEAFIERLDAAAVTAPEHFSLADGVSPPEGEVLAMLLNPDLRLQRLRAGVALATFENAGLWDDPVFGFDGAELLSPSGPFEYGLTIGLTIPVSGRLQVERDRAGAAYEAELREVVDREWSTRAEVRRAWARWTTACERLGVLRELVAELEHIVELTGRLRDAGEISRADLRVFTIDLAGRRADLLHGEAAVASHRAELLYLLGLPMDADIRIEAGLSPVELPDLEDDLDAVLIERNTMLAVHRAVYRTAEQTLRLEIRKQIPDLEIGGGYGSEDDDRLLLGLGISIPVLNANRAAIAEARATRELARAEAETTYERLSRDLAQAIIAYRQAAAARRAVETEVVSMAQEQLLELERLTELGEPDTLLLLESLTSLFDAKARVLELRLDEQVAAIRLAELLGPEEARVGGAQLEAARPGSSGRPEGAPEGSGQPGGGP